jgi:sugar phosphate isomerase/epimerase
MLAMAYITAEGADPLEQVEAAAAAGFDAIGLRATAPTGRPAPAVSLDDAVQRQRVAQALRSTGLGLLDLEVLTLSSDFDMDDARRLTDVAASLGGHYLQVVCEDPDLDRAADRLAGIALMAQASNVTIALEFMAFRTADSLATARAMVARGGARILIDALHLIRSGGTAADVAATPPERIAYFQLCDAPLISDRTTASTDHESLIHEARFNRLYPGEGALPLRAICAALPPNIAISVEVPHRLATDRSAHYRAATAFSLTQRFLQEADCPPPHRTGPIA